METSRGGARRRSAKILATKSQFTHSQSVGRDGTARCGESRHGPLWNQVSLGAQLLTRVGSPSLQPRPLLPPGVGVLRPSSSCWCALSHPV